MLEFCGEGGVCSVDLNNSMVVHVGSADSYGYLHLYHIIHVFVELGNNLVNNSSVTHTHTCRCAVKAGECLHVL